MDIELKKFMTILYLILITAMLILVTILITSIVWEEEINSMKMEFNNETTRLEQELSEAFDIVTGYRDENARLKLRPVILKNEIKYWLNIIEYTGLDIDLLLYIQEKCIEYDVKLDVVLGLIQVESNFDNSVINYNDWNDTYDRGLMQINSGYEKYYWNLSNIDKEFDGKLVSNPYYNVELGISYLRYQLDNFNNYYIEALGAYNRGLEGYKEYVRINNTKMTEYASKVLKFSNQFMKE